MTRKVSAEVDIVHQELQILFFFSSRRRHTRYIGDWSSDVCSSDLLWETRPAVRFLRACGGIAKARRSERRVSADSTKGAYETNRRSSLPQVRPAGLEQIGRASCRDRGATSEVVGSVKRYDESRSED